MSIYGKIKIDPLIIYINNESESSYTVLSVNNKKLGTTTIGIYPSTQDNKLRDDPYFKIYSNGNKYICRVSLIKCKYEYHRNVYDNSINAFLSPHECEVLNNIMHSEIDIKYNGEKYKSIKEAMFAILELIYPENIEKYEQYKSIDIDYRNLTVDYKEASKTRYESKTGLFFK